MHKIDQKYNNNIYLKSYLSKDSCETKMTDEFSIFNVKIAIKIVK